MRKTTSKQAPMSADAYAGFLKLWLAPFGAAGTINSDVREYLRYVERREPLSPIARTALGHTSDRAA